MKKDPLDFVLWQKSGDDEPFWESPWNPPAGGGRPGWHIECSSMIYQTLGERIDIHGGGQDLIFPHHESEIAQSESFSGKRPFVSYWMHTAMLLFKKEKMSKSLGNLVLVNDLRKTYSANAIRYLLLSNHYRLPWEYFDKDMEEAQRKTQHIEHVLQSKQKVQNNNTKPLPSVCKALEDDFNTPKALEAIGNEIESAKQPSLPTLRASWNLLGFI